MFSSAFIVFSVFMLLAQHCSIGLSSQPPYQVSLYLNPNAKSVKVHYCNGVIVQSRLVLTAASCTYYHPGPNTPIVYIKPQWITVVAGANGESFEEGSTFKVRDIEIAKEFNRTSLVNDLAVLRLAKFIPLGTRKDISWIILDEYDSYHDSETMRATLSSNAQTENLPMVNCTVYPNYICSIYPTKITNEDLTKYPALNGDRGTGLISRNHLIGIFSTVVPLSTTEECLGNKPQTALFTNLKTHLAWIYGVIANEEHVTVGDNNMAFSAPYREESAKIVDVGANGQSNSKATEATLSQAFTLPRRNVGKVSLFVILVISYSYCFGTEILHALY